MSDARDSRTTTTRDHERPAGPAPAYAPTALAPVDPLDDVRAPGWEDAAADAVAPADAPLAPERVEGNLRRYARWQWRDYWQRRGFWLAGAAMFCVWVMVHWVLADRLRVDPAGQLRAFPLDPTEVLAISHVAFAVGGVLAGLLGVGGLVSRERERGLQRFLFAKPVNIVRYYLQGFAINGVGSMVVLAGAALLAAATAPHALAVGSILAVAAGAYVLGAGVTFLVSTLWRFDAPIAGAYLAAGFPVVALAENGYRWAAPFKWLFPQGVALEVAKATGVFFQKNPMPSEITAVFLGVALLAALWGAACTVAGAVVLRRRAISA